MTENSRGKGFPHLPTTATQNEIARQLIDGYQDISTFNASELQLHAYDKQGNPHAIDCVSSLAKRVGFSDTVVRYTYNELINLAKEELHIPYLQVANRKYYFTDQLFELMASIQKNVQEYEQQNQARKESKQVADKVAQLDPESRKELMDIISQALAK
jgi:hypothetical protein